MNWDQALRRSVRLAIVLSFVAQPALAQLIGGHNEATNCASSVGGNVRDSTINVICGLSPEQVQELTRAAVAGATGPLANQIEDLSRRLGVTQGAALSLLRAIGQSDVPFVQMPEKLAEVASQYQQMQAQLAALNPDNPSARGFVEQAQAASTAGNLSRARELLRQARQAQVAASQQADTFIQRAQLAKDEQLIQAAASSAAEGDLALTELHYLDAAELFKEAANLVPSGSSYDDKRLGYLTREADALYSQGDEFGDNGALGAAIDKQKRLIELTPRARVPLDWAMTQNNLGTALERLGERESETARLAEAVAAYREALVERTRARVPLDWAMSFGNQGVALMQLAQRMKDAAMAQTAVLQIEAAFETMRDGGHAPFAAYYEGRLPEARRIRDALKGSSGQRSSERQGRTRAPSMKAH
jgi:tetratricopeptide (TPR) repeat protein